jgi:hypothetical protein
MKTSMLALALNVMLANAVAAYASENPYRQVHRPSNDPSCDPGCDSSLALARPIQTAQNRRAEQQSRRLRQLRLRRRRGRRRLEPCTRAAALWRQRATLTPTKRAICSLGDGAV